MADTRLDPYAMSAPPATAAPASNSWQQFQFQNPTGGYQQNFNYLAGIDPNLAFAYGFNPQAYNSGGNTNGPNALVQGLNGYGYGTGSAALNQYSNGGGAVSDGNGGFVGNAQMSSLGLPTNFQAPQISFDPTTGALMSGGQSYNLPGGGAQTAAQARGANTYGQDAGNNIGSADWMNSVNNFGAQQAASAAANPQGGAGTPSTTPWSLPGDPRTGSGQTLSQVATGPSGGTTYDQSGNVVSPSGTGGSLGAVNGVPGYTGGGSFDINNWEDPGYAFRLAQGNKLLQGSAAAQGNLLSGSTLKAISDYGQNSASQEYQNAFNRFNTNRQFNYGVDNNDRNFDYTAATGDRAYNQQNLQSILNAGLTGTQGAAGSNNALAAILAQLTTGGGNAASAGTIGGSNAINSGLSQAISNLITNGFLSNVGNNQRSATPYGG